MKLYKQNHLLTLSGKDSGFLDMLLPGTELLKVGIAKGLVSKEQVEQLNEGIDFFFFNNPDNIKDLCRLVFIRATSCCLKFIHCFQKASL